MSQTTDLIEFLNGVEPAATTAPSSQIDETVPVYGNPTTESVRANFATAKTEITGLMLQTQGSPFMPVAGGVFGGPVELYNDPTSAMMPVTLGYAQANFGVGGGSPSVPEAPTDGSFYTRSQGAWIAGVALQGGAHCQMTGELLLAANPTDALGAVPKQYADAIAATANGAVQIAGSIMTGPLLLSGDPTQPLGASTKQYTDAGLALKANAANPTFTGVATFNGGRNIIATASVPSLTLYDMTAGRPTFGIYNYGGLFSIGLTSGSTGNPNGGPFAMMDQTGNLSLTGRVNVTGGRLISSLNGNSPSITLNNTSQGNIFGMWNSGQLVFGLTDANGTPQSGLASMNTNGGWSLAGLYVSGNITGNTLNTTANASIGGTLGCAGNIGLAANGLRYLCSNGAYLQDFSTSCFILSDATNVVRFYSQNASPSMIWQTTSLFAISMSLDNSGNLSVYGTVAQGSDERLKTDIEDAPDKGIEIVRKLVPKTFARIHADDDLRELGFIAQDVRAVLPEAVVDMPAGDDATILGLQLPPLIAVLTNAVKELDRRLASLEGKRAA